MPRILIAVFLILALFITSCGSTTPPGTPIAPSTPRVALATKQVASTTNSPTSQPTAVGTAIAVDPETILKRVATLRELPIKSEVPLGYLKRDELRSYLAKDFDEDNSPEDLAKEKALYVTLGLLDQKDDLKELWIDLLTEQVLGFYDPKTHEMKIIGDTPATLSTMDELTLAHEYTHALQDQHYDLRAQMEKLKDDNEQGMAFQALLEGDATLTMTGYGIEYKTQAELAAIQTDASGVDMAKFNASPFIIQTELMFPYESGVAFANNMIKTGGWPNLDRCYAKLPLTTEQIYHPQKYRAEEGAKMVELPNVAAKLGPQWSLLDNDTFGEMGWYAFLGSSGDTKTAKGAAAGWGGDHYVLLKNSDGNTAFAALIEWDTPEDALEFHSGTIGLLQSRKGTELTATEDRTVRWNSPSVDGCLFIKENRTLLIVAPNEGLVEKIHASFSGF